MKNTFFLLVTIILSICFSSCKTKNGLKDNIDLGVMNNSLNHENIDVEILINDKLFLKKDQIESFFNEKIKLEPGNYLLKVIVKNKNIANIFKITIDENQSYLMSVEYTFNPPFDSAKHFILGTAIKNRIVKQNDSALFLRGLENNKASYNESRRKIKFEFINRKSIRIN
jgi:hypothetical protein